MNKKLDKVFRKAESEREKVLHLIRDIPADKLLVNPRKGKWSISQILSHIIEVERISLAYMKKKSLGIAAARDSGIWEDFKFLVLLISQRLPLKYKRPRIISGHDPASLTFPQIIQAWNAVRADLKDFLLTFDDRTIKRTIYKHAFSGRLNVVHAVKFFAEHLKHHLPQIKRLL